MLSRQEARWLASALAVTRTAEIDLWIHVRLKIEVSTCMIPSKGSAKSASSITELTRATSVRNFKVKSSTAEPVCKALTPNIVMQPISASLTFLSISMVCWTRTLAIISLCTSWLLSSRSL